VPLNRLQLRAVSQPHSVSLVSCPGSGKTRAIIAKLIRCLGDVRGTTRRIAAITYMNAAVDEIQHRMSALVGREDTDALSDVGTIHSFCLMNILAPNHWRLPVLAKGFRVLPATCEEYLDLITGITTSHGLDRRALQDFERLERQRPLPSWITLGAAEDYWCYLDAHGCVDFNDILYYSDDLVRQHPEVSAGLAAKYAWMLVDEFHDTTDHQASILGAVARHKRTRFFIVGDPYQSIMSFAGGRPELMDEFSNAVGADSSVRLVGNYRSSRRIVALAESVQPRIPHMEAVGESRDCDCEPVWVHTERLTDGIDDHFLPVVQAMGIPLGHCAVLAANYFILYDIGRHLRKSKVPIIGPGARPYRRAEHLIAPVAEELATCAVVADAKQFRLVRHRLVDLVLRCCPELVRRFASFDAQVAVAKCVRLAGSISPRDGPALQFIERLAKDTATVLRTHGLLSEVAAEMVTRSGLDMCQDIRQRRDVNAEALTVDDLGIFAHGDKCIKLLTFHKSKGREFDAVAMVRLHDGLIPYGSPTSRSPEEAESRRLFYVGVTRAKKVLMMFTDGDDRRNYHPSRFLSSCFPDGPGGLEFRGRFTKSYSDTCQGRSCRIPPALLTVDRWQLSTESSRWRLTNRWPGLVSFRG